jgi:anti-sigma regulatory factor (Ser/Thr protein kinase)
VRCDGPGSGLPARHRAPDVEDPDVSTDTLPILVDWSGYGRHAAHPVVPPADEASPGDGPAAVASGTTTVTVAIASPTPDLESATAKLELRVREQLAATGRTPPAVMTGLVVSEPHASTDPAGRVWYWFRGTLEVGHAQCGERPRTAPRPAPVDGWTWPVRPVPRRQGTGWECRLTSAPAAARVRRELRGLLQRASAAGHCTPDAGDDLLLAFEELTSNAFRHGAGTVDVTIAGAAGGWLLVVGDEAGDRPPVRVPGRDRALGGMGLEMVQGLAADFGWHPDRGGKRVWVELPSRR